VALFAPVLWALNLVLDRPTCLLCIERDDQGEDEG
jgi:hypothetical protein